MGAECIISGIRPQIAQTIVALGIEFGDIATKATPGRRAAATRCAARGVGRRQAPGRAGGHADGAHPDPRIGDILLVSIQVDLQDQIAVALQEDLAERIVETGAHGVLIDISALEIVDSFIGRMLSTIASVSRVLDAETVVVGMRPAVAITLVELGPVAATGVRTALDVDRGMAMLAGRARARDGVDPATRRDRGAVDERPRVDGRDARTTHADQRPTRTWCGCARPCATLAVAAKLSLVDQTKLVTAASELARNTLVYGGGGTRRGRARHRRPAARACGSPSPTRGPASPTSTWP